MSNKDPGTAEALQNGATAAGFTEQLQGCYLCGIIMVDERRRITAFNAQAEAITGRRAAKMLNGSVEKLPALLRQIIEETFSGWRAIVGRSATLPAAKRGKAEVRVTTAIAEAKAGKGRAVAVVLQDMTGGRRLELELPRLERL